MQVLCASSAYVKLHVYVNLCTTQNDDENNKITQLGFVIRHRTYREREIHVLYRLYVTLEVKRSYISCSHRYMYIVHRWSQSAVTANAGGERGGGNFVCSNIGNGQHNLSHPNTHISATPSFALAAVPTCTCVCGGYCACAHRDARTPGYLTFRLMQPNRATRPTAADGTAALHWSHSCRAASRCRRPRQLLTAATS